MHKQGREVDPDGDKDGTHRGTVDSDGEGDREGNEGQEGEEAMTRIQPRGTQFLNLALQPGPPSKIMVPHTAKVPGPYQCSVQWNNDPLLP